MIKHEQKYVKKKPMLYHILVLLLGCIFISCATTIAPTGGPRDTEAPEVLETKPETGTTNFEGKVFEFKFSEYINRSTIAKNITIEPDLGLEYSIKWKKKNLFIRFEEDLPDSTTIILTLGTGVSDTKNNKIPAPIKIAVSTGNEIDEGSIIGKIKIASTGESAKDSKVLLYREPVDLTQKASYIAETDTGGTFNFSYLREGTYKALYVDDRNRNKIWEQKTETAFPFNTEFIELGRKERDTLDVLYITQFDTLAPKLQGVGLFSSTRLRLRFNENIAVTENASISILDTLGNEYSKAYPLYISGKDPFVLFAQSEKELNRNELFSIRTAGIEDLAQNEVIIENIEFEGSSQQDTTLQRIIEHRTSTGLNPNQSVEVVYAAPISDPMITDSILVVEGDVSFDDWPVIRTDKNILYIDPQDSWIDEVDYQFLIWSPYTQKRQLLKPEVWSKSDLGELNITVQNSDSNSVVLFKLKNEQLAFEMDSVFSDNVLVEDLAPIDYTLILFEDKNKNGIWDSGSIIPFAAPEPYYVQRGIKIQSGFTSEVVIEF